MAKANTVKSSKGNETDPKLEVVGGAMAGAAVGSLLGPLGAAVGAVVGGVAGKAAGKQSKSEKPLIDSPKKRVAAKVKTVAGSAKAGANKAISTTKKSMKKVASKKPTRKK